MEIIMDGVIWMGSTTEIHRWILLMMILVLAAMSIRLIVADRQINRKEALARFYKDMDFTRAATIDMLRDDNRILRERLVQATFDEGAIPRSGSHLLNSGPPICSVLQRYFNGTERYRNTPGRPREQLTYHNYHKVSSKARVVRGPSGNVVGVIVVIYGILDRTCLPMLK